MNIEKLWGLWSARIEADKAIHKDAFIETIHDWLAAERVVVVTKGCLAPAISQSPDLTLKAAWKDAIKEDARRKEVEDEATKEDGRRNEAVAERRAHDAAMAERHARYVHRQSQQAVTYNNAADRRKWLDMVDRASRTWNWYPQ